MNKKILLTGLLIAILCLALTSSIQAEPDPTGGNFEFIVRVKDKLTTKRGDCIAFKPAGWDWGRMERQHYAILKIKNVTYDEAKEWCSFDENEITVFTLEGNEKSYRPKKHSFDIDDMSENEDWLDQDKKVASVLFNKEKIKLK